MKKPTAADRAQFRRDLAKTFKELGAEVGEITPDAVILCTRAEDFDPAQNILWEREANKSAARDDVQCTQCGHRVAMSNDAYSRYKAMDRKPRVCCAQCILTLAPEAQS